MKKAFIIIALGILFTSCVSSKTELEHYHSNKSAVAEEFPNYHITSFRQYSYIFQVSNPEHVIKVVLDNKANIVKKDTLKVFQRDYSIATK
jgi:hypothetical protein